MPAIPSQAFGVGVSTLQAREWNNTVGTSGMTPTAFAFLIPVFVVAVAAPIICVLIIRKRRQPVPVSVVKAPKKPALRRVEARERLNSVTVVSNRTGGDGHPTHTETMEDRTGSIEMRSIMERECAICLSTLHAPSPPEPVKLSHEPANDEAAKSPSVKDLTTSEPEAILKLQVCGHEFHAECLVSWFALRKTSCPICRAVYYSKEAMQMHDDEVAAAAPVVVEAPALAPVVVNNRWYFPRTERSSRASGT